MQPSSRIFANARVHSVKITSEKKKFDETVIREAECIIADETACAKLIARNEQIDSIQEGMTVTLLNAHAKVIQGGFIRIEVDKWAKINKAETEIEQDSLKLDNDMSAVSYELVNQSQSKDGSKQEGGKSNKNSKKNHNNKNKKAADKDASKQDKPQKEVTFKEEDDVKEPQDEQ